MRRLLLFWTAVAAAQRGGVDWSTSGNDAQRSSWVRTDPKISAESMRKPGFQLLWKIKLENEPRPSNSLTPIILLDKYTGYRGHKSLGFLGGSSDTIFALDTDLGLVHWQNHISSGPKPESGSAACPGGMTSAVTRPASAAIPGGSGFGGGGGGRGGPAQSGAGKPDQGAVTIAQMAAPRTGGSGRTFQASSVRPLVLVYALTSDGMLQTMYVSNGTDAEPATRFLPPQANAAGLVVLDGIAYVSTAHACGGVPNGVWALDLASKKVTTWNSGSAGTSSPAFSPDAVYVTAGSRLMALEPKTLVVKGSYTSGVEFVSPPVVFEYGKKIVLAAITVDGGIHLVDSGAKLLSKTAAHAAAGAPATWQDPAGVRWILAAEAGAVVGWKVADLNGAPVLQRGWTSGKIVAPLTPAVVNGVVFAVSGGKPAATLHALDGATGKELWNSGGTIASFVDSGGLSAGWTQVYLGTHDGTLYAFGFPIEH